MAVLDSTQAIGEVGELLKAQLTTKTSIGAVDVGRPEAAAAGGGPKLNLFLYQIDFDNHMRGLPLDRGQVPPLWMVLRYLMTAFDESNDSDSADAHKLLGEGLVALQELNFIESDATALKDNPEPLKVTFDAGDSDLLSKLMQSGDEKYRLSSAFQVRPVMLAVDASPSYAPAVKTVGPPSAPGIVVLPSMGPRLDAVDPEAFEAGDTVRLKGQDLGEVQEVCFGDTCFVPDEVNPERLVVTVPLSPPSPSAGNLPITAVRVLPSGRRFSSNAVMGRLLPALATATAGVLTPNGGGLIGDLTLSGERLGGETDSIIVAFYRDGSVELMREAVGSAAQTTLTVTVASDHPLPAGSYFVILRVNGEQAAETPEVNWS